MSSGNVEAVGRALAALDRRDVEAYLEVAENFDDFRYEVRGIRDAQDRVVALVDTIGRITPTGVEVSQRLGFVVSGFRDGTFRRFARSRAGTKSRSRGAVGVAPSTIDV